MSELSSDVRDELDSRTNVVGTAIGYKRIDGRATGEKAIVVFVDRKLPRTELDEEDIVPETVQVADEEVKTDVQEVGNVKTQSTTREIQWERYPNRRGRVRPAPAGVSLGHPDITAGTLGSPSLEDEGGNTVVLTNSHVAAPIDEAAVGDPVLQPGPTDGGETDDAIGELTEWSRVTKDGPNTTDSALVSVDKIDVENEVLGLGPLMGWTESELDAEYVKSGRTTGVTTGTLRGHDARIEVNGYYREPVVFEDVTVFEPMSAGGDSGSLIGIMRDDGFYGTHLLFAGSDRATVGIPMSAVRAEHGALIPIVEKADNGPEPDVTFRERDKNVLIGLLILWILNQNSQSS